MFGNKVNSTTLTTKLVDHACPNITAMDFRGDNTLLAVARALCAPRGKEFHGLICDFNREEYNDEKAVKDYLVAWMDANMTTNVVAFFNIRRSENAESAFTCLDEVANLIGFKMNEQGSDWLTKFCNDKKVVVYNNEEAQQSIVATTEISMHQWHALVSGMSICYAMWVGEYGKYSPEEVKMLQSLVDPEMGVDQFMDAVEAIASECFDLQTEAKKYYLNGFESRALTGKIRSLRQQSENVMREIERYTSHVRELYDKKAGTDAMLSAAMSGGSSGNELMEYFLANKKLFVDAVSDDDSLTYFVGGYIDNFDQEVFERVLENPGSVIHTRFDSVSSEIMKEDYVKLLEAIFLDETIKVKMYSKWRLGTGGWIEAVKEENPPVQLRDCLPNPHLMYFRCYGSFEPELMSAADRHDYIRAVDISSAENGNVNWNDVTVMERFIRDILTKRIRFLELPDGTCVTNTEAIAWLKTKDEQA